MKHVLGALGVLAASVLLAVSAAMNWRFGYSLGMTEVDKNIYGAASVAADCFKALVPFFFFAALASRKWSQASASAVLWGVVTAYSMASALGHASLNRAFTASERTVAHDKYADLRVELKGIQKTQEWAPQHRASGAIAAEIDGMKVQREWAGTKQCSNVVGPIGREFCTKLSGLNSELATAQSAEKQESRVAEIQSELKGASAFSAMDADPQATAISGILGKFFEGVNTKGVQMALVLGVAILLEIGSGFGMYAAFSYWNIFEHRAAKASFVRAAYSGDIVKIPPTDGGTTLATDSDSPNVHRLTPPVRTADVASVTEFKADRIVAQGGSSLTATAAYDEYVVWSEGRKQAAVTVEDFTVSMQVLGVNKATIAGRVRYLGIALRRDTAEPVKVAAKSRAA